MNAPKRSTTLLFFFGVVFISVLIYISIRYPDTIQEYFGIYKVILSIACAGIASLIPGFFNIRYKSMIRAGGALGVFTFIFLFLHPNDNTFTVRAVVKSAQDQSIDPASKVILYLGIEPRDEPLSVNNDALFENIPIKYLNTAVKFGIKSSERLALVNPDSMYVLASNKIVYLTASLQFNSIVKGTVLYNDKPVDSVEVSIDDIKRMTDHLGYYKIELDKSFLKNEQTVIFYKQGFKLSRKRIFLQSLKNLDVVLEK